MEIPLDMYEVMPREQRSYLANYGWSFNRKACMHAVKKMKRKNPATGKEEPIDIKSKEEVEEILKKFNITLEYNKGYDFVYVFHMAMADYFKSSLTDEQHVAMFVKDYIDDIDNPGGNVFRKWYVDMIAKGEPVEWSDLI